MPSIRKTLIQGPFPQFLWKQKWWAIFSDKFLQSHATDDDNLNSHFLEYRQLVTQQNIRFDLKLESLRQNGCLHWFWSKEMYISYTRCHCFYGFVYIQSWFLNIKAQSCLSLPSFFSPFFFFLLFPPSSLSFFLNLPLFSFSYSPIYKSDFFGISPSYNVTGVTLILPPSLEVFAL